MPEAIVGHHLLNIIMHFKDSINRSTVLYTNVPFLVLKARENSHLPAVQLSVDRNFSSNFLLILNVGYFTERITVVISSWQGMLTLIFTNAHFWNTTIIPKTSANYSETIWVVDCSLHSLGESSAMFRVNCPFNGTISVTGGILVSEIIFFNAIFGKEDVQQYHLLFLLQNKQGTRCRSVRNAFIY